MIACLVNSREEAFSRSLKKARSVLRRLSARSERKLLDSGSNSSWCAALKPCSDNCCGLSFLQALALGRFPTCGGIFMLPLHATALPLTPMIACPACRLSRIFCSKPGLNLPLPLRLQGVNVLRLGRLGSKNAGADALQVVQRGI